jgi:cytochrome c oxidase subunit II
MNQLRHKSVIASACLAAAILGGSAFRPSSVRAQGQGRDFAIRGDQFAFSPSRIDVQKDDLVKVTFTAGDMPHSFTIDGYRIAKRAGAGQTVVFEFRADQVGTFDYYCNLTQDDRCRQMKGKLVVK